MAMTGAKKREYARRYYQAHREEIIARQRERRAAETPEHRAHRLEVAKRWKREHPHESYVHDKRYRLKRLAAARQSEEA